MASVICRVSCWRFLLDDAPRLGRPVEVDGDQMEPLTENNQCYPTWEITDIIQISKSIRLLVKMNNVSFILWKKTDFLASPEFSLDIGRILGWRFFFSALEKRCATSFWLPWFLMRNPLSFKLFSPHC